MAAKIDTFSSHAPGGFSHAPRGLLLTGFGPFPGVANNISGPLVMAVADAARQRFPGRAIHAEVLETNWHAAPARLAELYRTFQPAIALHCGVSRKVETLTLETIAHNQCSRIPDHAGDPPQDASIIADGPPHYRATLPFKAIEARLNEKRIAWRLSDDAGRYLCNAVLYHALACTSACMSAKDQTTERNSAPAELPHEARQQALRRPPQIGFIHLPAHIECSSQSYSEAVNAILEIIDVIHDLN